MDQMVRVNGVYVATRNMLQRCSRRDWVGAESKGRNECGLEMSVGVQEQVRDARPRMSQTVKATGAERAARRMKGRNKGKTTTGATLPTAPSHSRPASHSRHQSCPIRQPTFNPARENRRVCLRPPCPSSSPRPSSLSLPPSRQQRYQARLMSCP